ncbi:hypothetical protein ACFX4X_10570 [Peribacillus sp. YIM B13481]|uniref:hypothetical protein n=1 Tax=Peribacillus sp. YIM B13481 TaxID=3366299 RepID=UPI00366F9347
MKIFLSRGVWGAAPRRYSDHHYLIGSYVYGIAHLPYIIFPNVTILSGFTDPTSFRAVFATYIVGFVILVPGYFWSIFMKDQRRKLKRRQMSN